MQKYGLHLHQIWHGIYSCSCSWLPEVRLITFVAITWSLILCRESRSFASSLSTSSPSEELSVKHHVEALPYIHTPTVWVHFSDCSPQRQHHSLAMLGNCDDWRGIRNIVRIVHPPDFIQFTCLSSVGMAGFFFRCFQM